MALPDTPWKIFDTGSAFVVSDAHGRKFAWFYYRREEALRAEYLTPDQARDAAVAFAQISKNQPPSTPLAPLTG